MDLPAGELVDASLSHMQDCAYFLRDDAVSGGSEGCRVCPFWPELHVSELSLQVADGVVIKGCSG